MLPTFAAAMILLRFGFPQTVPDGFTVEPYGAGIEDGTAMAWAPDGRLFVCEQGGAIRVIKDGILQDAPFHALAVHDVGERGLLGIAFSPGFLSDGFVYVYSTTPPPAPHNRISRLRANPPGSDVSDGSETVLVDLDNLSEATNHNGGALHFGPDGKLYAAVGENANPSNAQDATTRLGKILRYNPDGTIPDDNPSSVSGLGSPSGGNRAIWAAGLRNPFTFAFQPGTGRMFINDVGQDAFEEVNEGFAGANYGWPATEGPFDAAAFPDFTPPVHAYEHDGEPRAISGGAFYNPSTVQFPPSFVGKYFYAEFVGGWIDTIDPEAPAGATRFATSVPGPVDLRVGPDGALYVLVRSGSPGVHRIGFAAATSSENGDGGCGGTGLEVLAALAAARLLRRAPRGHGPRDRALGGVRESRIPNPGEEGVPPSSGWGARPRFACLPRAPVI